MCYWSDTAWTCLFAKTDIFPSEENSDFTREMQITGLPIAIH